jgi:hypothetical protein
VQLGRNISSVSIIVHDFNPGGSIHKKNSIDVKLIATAEAPISSNVPHQSKLATFNLSSALSIVQTKRL